MNNQHMATLVFNHHPAFPADFEFKNQPATKLNRRASNITGRDKTIKAHFSSYFPTWRKWEF